QDRYTTAGDFAADLRRVLQTTAEVSVSRHMPGETPATVWRAATPATHQPGTLTPPSSSRSRVREAARRPVAALVCGCDLFESEAYLGLDAEDQAEVLRAFRQGCEQAVRRFDGAVVQCDEQGLLACFGYPVAYEDAARRAARGALGLLDDLKA